VAKATRERIAAISKNIRLGISDGKAAPTGANSDLKVNYDGLTIPPWEDDGENCRIYLAYQIIKPLLDDEIGPSTKLALQFHLALTLLHEFAVSSRQLNSYLKLTVSSMSWFLLRMEHAMLSYISTMREYLKPASASK
jgi:hypothetical protein